MHTKKSKIIDTLSWRGNGIWDRNRCSKKKYVTIPYSNCSESSNDSWFVSYYAHMPTENAKLLTPSIGGRVKDRNRCSEKMYVTIPYSNCSKLRARYEMLYIVK